MSSNPTILSQSQILPYRCVKMTTTAGVVAPATSSTDIVFGVTTNKTTSANEALTFQQEENNFVLLTAGGSISVGNLLNPSTGGTVVASTDGGGQFIATESAASGETLWCRYTNSKSSSSQINYLAPGSSTTKEVSSKLAEQLSVKDFGAVGDGATDDTAAIQAALTSAGTTDSSVFFPATSSFYRITNKLTIPNGVSVVGEGFGSLIKQITLKKNIFEMGHDTVISNLNLEMPTNVAAGYDYANQNAVYAAGKNNVAIVANWIKLSRTECGVQINACRDVSIKDNIVYGSTWDADPTTSSSGDIVVVGSDVSNTLGINRIIVENNFSLSNNCLGIWVDAYGGNADIVVNGNVVVTLDATTCTVGGTWAEAANGGVRRHAISVGYGDQTVDGPRAVVSNNVCRNTRLTGIYLQGGTLETSGPIVCVNNVISKVSQNTADTSGLTGGIWTSSQSPKTLIANNLIYKNTHPTSGGINFIATGTTPVDGPTFSNNTIIESAGYGFMISSRAGKCVIKGNVISGTTKNDIWYGASSGRSDVGGLIIEDNVFKRTNYNFPSVLLDSQVGTVMSFVRNNYFKGHDRTSGGGSPGAAVTELNAGVRVSQPLYTQIFGNVFENFHVAVSLYQYFADTTRFFTVNYSNNLIKDCNVGFGISKNTSNDSTVPLCDNVFDNVTSKTSISYGDGSPGGYKCGYIASKQGDKIVVYELNAVPGANTGRWAIGDRIEYTTPTAGGFLGAVCTAAGSPGTWKTYGAISV